MASILNADNGVVSGTSGLKYSSDNSGVIELQTSGATTLTLNTSKNAVFANSANVTGVFNAGNTAITGTLTASANVNFDSGTLFVDGTNNRIGVNNTSPTQALTVTGTSALGNTFITGAVGINNTTPNSSISLVVSGNTSFLNHSNTYLEFVGVGTGIPRMNAKGSTSAGAVYEHYVYSANATTSSAEVAYMSGGLSNTSVGYWNFQTKSGSSWNNTVLIKSGIFDVTGTINVSNTGTYAVGNTNIWYKTGSPSGSINWIHGDHPISAFSHDVRSPRPSDFLGHAGQFLFTSYGLDSSSPYGDAIHVNSYNDSSGGDPNILVINKASNGVKVARGGWGSYYVPSSTQYSSGSVYTLNYTSASDASVKEDVQNITNGLDIIKQLRPVTYKWTDEYILAGFSKNSEEEVFDENGRLTTPTNKVINVGLIAQEVLQVLPTVVQNNNVSLPGTNDFLLNVSYEKIVPHLIAAIKEQQDIIEQLKTRMDSAGI